MRGNVSPVGGTEGAWSGRGGAGRGSHSIFLEASCAEKGRNEAQDEGEKQEPAEAREQSWAGQSLPRAHERGPCSPRAHMHTHVQTCTHMHMCTHMQTVLGNGDAGMSSAVKQGPGPLPSTAHRLPPPSESLVTGPLQVAPQTDRPHPV